MPKTIEQGSNRFTTWLGNATALPTEWIKPLFAINMGYIGDLYSDEDDENQAYYQNLPIRGWCWFKLSLGREETKSLFYNSVFYVRLMLPFWVGMQIRWAGKSKLAKEYLQLGIGWKLNGRFGVLCRVQSDANAAAGVSGPNHGQAKGFNYGTK